MKKLISMVLIMMILCSLLTVSALAENAQGQAAASAQTATMTVTGGTINPDGTVSWAVGENIVTITMPDGSVYTITVIYEPEAEESAKTEKEAAPAEAAKTEEAAATEEAAKTEEAAVTEEAAKTEEAAATEEAAKTEEAAATEEAAKTEEAAATEEAAKTEEAAAPEENEAPVEPVVLSALTVSGTALPVDGDTAAAVTPNVSDLIAVVTEPADATVTINGVPAENGESMIDWAAGSNVVTVEVAKEGYATTTFTLNIEYTPAEDAVPAENTEESAAPVENTLENAAPAEDAAPAENTEENGAADGNAAQAEEAAPVEESSEADALAALTIDKGEIDLDKFVKGSSDEKQSSYSFNAAANGEYDLTTNSGIVEVNAADGWTVSSVKLNGVNQTAAGTGSYPVKWAKANDLEITLKKTDSEFKAVYSLILSNVLNEITADALTVNGADVTFLNAIQAAADNSYSLQVVAGEGKTAAVSVNGIPVTLDANGTLVIPAVTGDSDSIVVTVSKEGCLDKTYSVTVSAAPATSDQAQPVAEESDNTDAAAQTEPVVDESVNAEEETADSTTAPEAVL